MHYNISSILRFQVVNGGPLPSLKPYTPTTSFSQEGRYIGKYHVVEDVVPEDVLDVTVVETATEKVGRAFALAWIKTFWI